MVLTFDDGYYDFKAKALPLLEERSYPATVYVTTERWTSDLSDVDHLSKSYLSWRSGRAGVSSCPARALSVMTPSEVADIAARGVAVEMHTHRHRLSPDVDGLLRDIRVNRDLIAATTGRIPRALLLPGRHLSRAPGATSARMRGGDGDDVRPRPGRAVRAPAPAAALRRLRSGLTGDIRGVGYGRGVLDSAAHSCGQRSPLSSRVRG